MKNTKRLLPCLLPIRSVVFLLVFMAAAFISGKNVSGFSCWWSIIASVVNLFMIALLILITKKQGSSYWKLINYEKGKTTGKQIIIVSAVILVIGMAGMYLAGYICYGKIIPHAAAMMMAPIPLWLAAVNIVVLPVSTAFAEDGLYLG